MHAQFVSWLCQTHTSYLWFLPDCPYSWPSYERPNHHPPRHPRPFPSNPLLLPSFAAFFSLSLLFSSRCCLSFTCFLSFNRSFPSTLYSPPVVHRRPLAFVDESSRFLAFKPCFHLFVSVSRHHTYHSFAPVFNRGISHPSIRQRPPSFPPSSLFQPIFRLAQPRPSSSSTKSTS